MADRKHLSGALLPVDPSDPMEAAVRKQGLPVGGVAGHILRKASATDYDDDWVHARSVGQVLFFGRATTTQALTAGAWAAVNLPVEDVDTDGAHSTSSATSRFVAPIAGYYRAQGTAIFANNATSYRWAQLAKQGALVPGTLGTCLPTVSNTACAHTAAAYVYLTAGQYLELWAQSGVALNLDAATSYGSSLAVELARAGAA